MIQSFFQSVIDIEGVEAFALFDNQNTVLDAWSIPDYHDKIFSEAGEGLMHIYGLMEHLSTDINEFVMPFDRGVIFARNHEKFSMAVFARARTDVAHIRLAINVCEHEFLSNRKNIKMIKKLPERKFYQIKTITLDDVEKIMLENILEERSGQR